MNAATEQLLKLAAGCKVEYTSKAGNVGVYTVVEINTYRGRRKVTIQGRFGEPFAVGEEYLGRVVEAAPAPAPAGLKQPETRKLPAPPGRPDLAPQGRGSDAADDLTVTERVGDAIGIPIATGSLKWIVKPTAGVTVGILEIRRTGTQKETIERYHVVPQYATGPATGVDHYLLVKPDGVYYQVRPGAGCTCPDSVHHRKAGVTIEEKCCKHARALKVALSVL